MSMQAFVSRRVVTPQGVKEAAILVEDERIRALIPPPELAAHPEIPASGTHDFRDAAILPGLIDSHVHINEPGRADWEGFGTATQAAAAGGCTMLVDMPLNCLPATTTIAGLEAKRHAANGQCWVDWAAWGGLVSGNHHDLEALAAAGVAGFKCFLIHPGIDSFTMVTERELRAALPSVARTGLPLLVHCELPGPVEEATARLAGADWRRHATFLESRPDEAELAAIRLIVGLCREGLRAHIVHLSTSRALPDLRAAQSEGLALSVETCPHYLRLEAERIPDGATQYKCAPPLRSRKNREALWQGLREGLIDLIATDHSPCTPGMKLLDEGNFKTAWGGIASLSLALPVVWTEAQQRGFGLPDIARWMAEKPARLAGCNTKGRIAPGYDADLVIFDPEREFGVSRDYLRYRHPISPYLGETLRGVVKATYLRGQPVFRDGEFCGRPRGREVRP